MHFFSLQNKHIQDLSNHLLIQQLFKQIVLQAMRDTHIIKGRPHLQGVYHFWYAGF